MDFDYSECARAAMRAPKNLILIPCKLVADRSTKAATPFNYTLVSEFGEETSSKWQEGTKSSGRTVSAAASTTAACVSTT